jgi:hypothetical protein
LPEDISHLRECRLFAPFKFGWKISGWLRWTGFLAGCGKRDFRSLLLESIHSAFLIPDALEGQRACVLGMFIAHWAKTTGVATSVPARYALMILECVAIDRYAMHFRDSSAPPLGNLTQHCRRILEAHPRAIAQTKKLSIGVSGFSEKHRKIDSLT